MIAALNGSYVEYVIFNGVTEKYPLWFENDILEYAFTDESRFTFWVVSDERSPDYHEKQLIEDYSVFLRKPNGDVHMTDYDVFQNLYTTFTYDKFTNSGIAAFESDCIEYVECWGGVLSREYPDWFYEFFTEAVNLPQGETVYFHDHDMSTNTSRGPFLEVSDDGQVSIDGHCVFLRNRMGEIKGMFYEDFKKYYDDDPLNNPIGGFTS